MISCDVGDVAHDLLGAAFEHLVLRSCQLVPDLVEDREAVVEEIVQHLVEQAPEPFVKRFSEGLGPPRSAGKRRVSGSSSAFGSVTRCRRSGEVELGRR